MFAIFTLLFMACSDINQFIGEDVEGKDDEILKSSVFFDENYKKMYVDLKISKDNIIKALHEDIDSIVVVEKSSKTDYFNPQSQPTLIGVNNFVFEKLVDTKMHLLIVADLTLTDLQIATQKQIVKEIYKIFNNNNLYIAFMGNDGLSETMLVDNYVIANKFVPCEGQKFLYRSILSKIDEMKGAKPKYYKNNSSLDFWKELNNSQKFLFVMSDDKVYENGEPIDEQHFELQREINEIGQNNKHHNHFSVSYLSFDEIDNNEILFDVETEVADEDLVLLSNIDAEYRLSILAQNTGGKYQNVAEFQDGFKNILTKFIDKIPFDYRLVFENPVGKVFSGNTRSLYIVFYQKEDKIINDNVKYSLGSIYDPIVVDAKPQTFLFLSGIIKAVFLMLFIYLFFQVIYPYILYYWFKKKYITSYKNSLGSYNGSTVEQTCYYCKAPFEVGDEIVVKCNHTVHKDCWDENGQKCPEYGESCKTGSHYYNQENLLDYHNAPFFMKWLLAGVLAGVAAWISFYLLSPLIHIDSDFILTNLANAIHGTTLDADDKSRIFATYISQVYNLPLYGINFSFWISLFLSILMLKGKWDKILKIILTVLTATLSGYFSFLLASVISIALGITYNSLLIYVLGFILMGISMVYIITFRVGINRKHVLWGIAATIVFGILASLIRIYIINSQLDQSFILLISYVVYTLGFAISLAVTFPKSRRYFLRVEGAIKPIDIAIYKWFRSKNKENRIVIGKSIDCDIQLSWDLSTDIMPLQASVIQKNGYKYLVILEDGVYMDGKKLPVDSKVKLYHGDSFKIGRTLLTYIEKDV